MPKVPHDRNLESMSPRRRRRLLKLEIPTPLAQALPTDSDFTDNPITPETERVVFLAPAVRRGP